MTLEDRFHIDSYCSTIIFLRHSCYGLLSDHTWPLLTCVSENMLIGTKAHKLPYALGKDVFNDKKIWVLTPEKVSELQWKLSISSKIYLCLRVICSALMVPSTLKQVHLFRAASSVGWIHCPTSFLSSLSSGHLFSLTVSSNVAQQQFRRCLLELTLSNLVSNLPGEEGDEMALGHPCHACWATLNHLLAQPLKRTKRFRLNK